MTAQHRPALAVRDTVRSTGIRTRAAGAVAVLAAFAEVATPLPGLRLAVAVGIAAGPALAFDGLWRALAWLRAGGLDPLLRARHRPGWRGRRLLWVAFAAGWLLDAAATVSFFRVGSLVEVNPVTVASFGVAGLPGVVAAAAGYALLVAVAVRVLPAPVDFDALLGATLLYAGFVVHNAVLLLGGA